MSDREELEALVLAARAVLYDYELCIETGRVDGIFTDAEVAESRSLAATLSVRLMAYGDIA